jgi:phage FluMu gp28-like protein
MLNVPTGRASLLNPHHPRHPRSKNQFKMKKTNYKPKSKSQSSIHSVPSAASVVNPDSSLLSFRPYQRKVFDDRITGIQVWLWGRQTGKSYTLAAWAVDRLLTRPGRLVTVLSNSKVNGIEFNLRCAEVCHKLGQAFEQEDLSPDRRYETMNCETRIRVAGKVGRIKILAANPRTARGFSGDLILDEFAFHEDGNAIWNAAEPILSSHADYFCRIASTPNGKHNLFYRMCTNGLFPVSKVTRTDAYADGCQIFHPNTREPIDPITARNIAPNKRVYDQNYECVFEDENMALLTHELITAAERPNIGVVCEHDWSGAALDLLTAPLAGLPGRKTARQWVNEAPDEHTMNRHILLNVCRGSIDVFERLFACGREFCLDDVFDEYSVRAERDAGRYFFAGVDVGRNRDRTVITVVEKCDNLYVVRAILRLDDMRLPEQQQRLETILNIPGMRMLKMDATGIGVGLYEYTQNKFPDKVQGINFSTTVSLGNASTQSSVLSPRNFPSVRVTEYLATQLLQTYEDHAIHQPIDNTLRDDLRKPERLLSPSGRVSIAATRDEAGHADHFWSLALAIDAAKTPIAPPFWYHSFTPRARIRSTTL